MCAITGKISFNEQKVTEQEIKAMNDCLKHRGPDGEGIFINQKGNVGLGHRRLAIIDLSEAGKQPMTNEDGTVWLVFNGEIYNFLELRPELERRGHKFRSRTDTEVIVHLWEEYGEKCLDYLQGMFALAIWDEKQQKLFLARDRMGKKPLKYYLDGNCLIFASELKAILKIMGNKAEIDREVALKFFSLNHVPAPETGFKNIKKLPAGYYAIWQDGRFQLQKYWELDFGKETTLGYLDAIDELKRLLKEAVKKRLMADVPLGVFLSGGVDSAAIVAMMSELNQKTKTFTVGFAEKGLDERALARKIAEKFGTEHVELEVKPDAIEILPKLVYHYEEPYADSSALATYYIAKESQPHIKVALTGDGGDEAFGGYRRYYYWNLLHNFKRNFYDDLASRHYFKGWVSGDKLRNLNDVLALAYRTFLPDDLLVKADIATMANGLEARSPFLDQKLVEFAASLPVEWKINLFTTKKILRDAFWQILPREVLRGKRGFVLPVDDWFRNQLWQWSREILLDEKTLRRGYFERAKVEQILNEHKSGKKNHGQRIWLLLCWEFWQRQFIK